MSARDGPARNWADAGKEGAGPGAKGEGEGALGQLGPRGEGSEEKRAADAGLKQREKERGVKKLFCPFFFQSKKANMILHQIQIEF